MSIALQYDMIVVGGGLSGSLLAWRLRQTRPDLRVALIERGPVLGGNHTWSFFETDLTPAQLAWMEPLICHRWPSYQVRFPRRARTLATGYRSVTSDRLAAVVSASLGADALVDTVVASVTDHGVVLADQRVLEAACIIDARGDRRDPNLVLGFQKFLGLEVRVAEPHGLSAPIIMDATVEQNDGYRFVYTLPLAPDRLLIEDTYYSDGVGLAPEDLRVRLRAYAARQGWRIADVVREETGVLPILLAGDVDKYLAGDQSGACRIGLGAGLFHPTTGYSLPDAVRVADMLSAAPSRLTTEAARRLMHARIRSTWQERAFFRLLNRMLFKAGRPDRRYGVLERFYGLDAGLIRSFYAGRLSTLHKARLLIGKPPVPIREAVRCVSERELLAQALLEHPEGA